MKISQTIFRSALALFLVVMLSACPAKYPPTVEPPVSPTEPVVTAPEEAPAVSDDADAATTDHASEKCTTDEHGVRHCELCITDENGVTSCGTLMLHGEHPPEPPTEPVVTTPDEASTVPDDAATNDADAVTLGYDPEKCTTNANGQKICESCSTDENGVKLCKAMIIDQ